MPNNSRFFSVQYTLLRYPIPEVYDRVGEYIFLITKSTIVHNLGQEVLFVCLFYFNIQKALKMQDLTKFIYPILSELSRQQTENKKVNLRETEI